MHTHATAPTQFIDAGGVRYAYRRFGTLSAVPIVLLQHFTGGLDHWDPAFTDGVAASREVILVDNAGVGASTGETPQTIEGMADCIREFVDALALPSFDLLGFSMGGMVAQAYAKQHADRIRRLVLVGTSPRGGDPTPFGAEVTQRARGNAGEEEMAWLFFGHSDAGRAAAARYWQRRHARTEDRDPPSEMPTILAQVACRPRLAGAARRALRRSRAHHRPDAGGERPYRRDAADDQLLLPPAAPAERAADPVPGFRARAALPVSGAVRRASGSLPRLIRTRGAGKRRAGAVIVGPDFNRNQPVLRMSQDRHRRW